ARMTTIRQVEVFPVGVPITRGFTFASGNAGAAGQKACLVFIKLTAAPARSGGANAVHPDESQVRALALTAFAAC
ncbi:MAG: hypothetical protein ABIQ12_15100, partial [Opitutaceae bacterium]